MGRYTSPCSGVSAITADLPGHWIPFRRRLVLWREFVALYEAFAAGRPSPLPELPFQYADYALWQRLHLAGDTLAGEVDPWRRELALPKSGARYLFWRPGEPAPVLTGEVFVVSPGGSFLPGFSSATLESCRVRCRP